MTTRAKLFTAFATAFAALCFALCLCVLPLAAHADTPNGQAPEGYKYQVTIYPGDGTIDGSSKAQTITVKNGESVDLTAIVDAAAPNDSRYFVKGIRLAGHDIADLASTNPKVTGDVQYVITYGLKKDMVAYTVNFVDEDGNAIAESETLYGVPGDKPVVAYRYIERYLPNAYNLTGTLSANPEENVFTFVYRDVPGINYVQLPGETIVEETTVEATAEGAGVDPTDAAAVEDAAAAGELIDEDGNPLAAPEEIVDIDENDNPLANGDAANSEDGGVNPFVVAAAVAVVAILLLVLFFARRRKDTDK